MDNAFDEVERALQQARMVNTACDQQTGAMAMMIAGRLHNIGDKYQHREALIALKKELRDFNMVTGCWKL